MLGILYDNEDLVCCRTGGMRSLAWWYLYAIEAPLSWNARDQILATRPALCWVLLQTRYGNISLRRIEALMISVAAV